ncbi:MAG: RNA-directed DNA polymerase [Proteobacteria bacterium]|nr:RNA-directed DNA polymerase [Pseudomonadota bacterium]
MATMPVRLLNLVAPLAATATAMHTRDIPSSGWHRSRAVARPSNWQGDVDSATSRRSTPATPPTPGIRTSTMATRTTTTRATRAASAPSADSTGYAGPSFSDLVQAYFDCRRAKRNSDSALRFEIDLEHNLVDLYAELRADAYTPGRSICFVVTHPKPREVWAAEFRDRVVHHLLYNHVASSIHARFISTSCACIPGRGTLYGAQRLEAMIRSQTQNWSKPAYYLKGDIANFFVSINKQILFELLARHITESWWLELARQILFHDPRENFEHRGNPALLQRVPRHKRLAEQPAHLGLPIGNLSSQFFANVYLDVLDQHVKHRLHFRHYVRYVDDFILLHDSPDHLNHALADISALVRERLAIQLNPCKTILQPIARGVDFVGHVIKPWRRTTRRKTVQHALARLETSPTGDLYELGNSYFGLLGQATHSHTDRSHIALALMKRGYSVNAALTKTFRRK